MVSSKLPSPVNLHFFRLYLPLPLSSSASASTPLPSDQSPPSNPFNNFIADFSPKHNPFNNLVSNFTSFLKSIFSNPPPSPISSPVPPPVSQTSIVPSCCTVPLFRPYVAKVPWHGGPRAFLSRLFPRYGHYCGPNWSSGKEGGLNLWDQRPIDWLDHCCYCHDIGYDTHDQAKLLKADLAFLECLERPRMATKGGVHMSIIYRAMCIAGLRSFLIPYRTHMVRLQSGRPFFEFFNDFIGKIAIGPLNKNPMQDQKFRISTENS